MKFNCCLSVEEFQFFYRYFIQRKYLGVDMLGIGTDGKCIHTYPVELSFSLIQKINVGKEESESEKNKIETLDKTEALPDYFQYSNDNCLGISEFYPLVSSRDKDNVEASNGSFSDIQKEEVNNLGIGAQVIISSSEDGELDSNGDSNDVRKGEVNNLGNGTQDISGSSSVIDSSHSLEHPNININEIYALLFIIIIMLGFIMIKLNMKRKKEMVDDSKNSISFNSEANNNNYANISMKKSRLNRKHTDDLANCSLKKNHKTQMLSNVADTQQADSQVSRSKPSVSQAAKHQAKPLEKTSTLVKPKSIVFEKKEKTSWFVLSYSAIGAGHIKHDLPCQDCYHVEPFANSHWGVAVVCDGMGSKSLSHIGAEFVSRKTAEKLKKLAEREKWSVDKKLPTEKVWQSLSVQTLYLVYQELVAYAKAEQLPINQMGCTVIAVIYSPIGLLVTHIGDGRAGYCNYDGVWEAMMTPFNGEEANQTIAITSNIWTSEKVAHQFVHCNVINKPVQAFCLMSDGSEGFAYETVQWNEKTNACDIVNKPAEVFFNPVIRHVRKTQNNSPDWQDKLKQSWAQLLIDGTPQIAQEPDDKTIVLGIMLNL